MQRILGVIKQTLVKDKGIIAASLLAGAVFTVFASMVSVAAENYSDNIQTGIAEQVLRFQVRANSDSPYDQNLKLAVRDKILTEFSGELESTESVEETREILFLNIDRIEAAAKEELKALGSDYPVSVELVSDFFPTKRYADITLPAGCYEALRVNIGAASGKNWWCVMYPPLCYVDATQAKAPEKTKDMLRETLSAEEYRIVTVASKDSERDAENLDVKVKFKVVEWWQNRKEQKAVRVASAR